MKIIHAAVSSSGNISRSHCVSGLTANDMDAITLENATKSYDSVTAVNGVNLRVRQGAILGLLGPNGAGKTTTIRMIMNILVPDEGSIKVLDKPVSDSTRDLIGYLPEERGLYPRMKVLDIIVFLAALHGLTEEEAGRRAKEWLERLGSAGGARKKIRRPLQGHAAKSAVYHRGHPQAAAGDSGRTLLRPRPRERRHGRRNHARDAREGFHYRSLNPPHGTGRENV